MNKIIILILILINLLNAEDAAVVSRIADIKYTNIYPFFSNEITNLLTIRPGDDLDSNQINLQLELIRAFYQRKGFELCSVSKNLDYIDKRDCIIEFKIIKGKYYSINKVRVDGNNSFWDIRILKESGLFWNSFLPNLFGRYSDEELQKDLKKIDQFYREKNFYDVSVKEFIEKDSSYNAEAEFRINEGKPYEIEFTGNDFFWNYELNDIIKKISTNGRSGEEIMRRTKRQIFSRYKEDGFNSVNIDLKIIPADSTKNDENKVIYAINEGIRPLVSEIIFNGNNSMKSSNLRRYVKSVFSDAWSFKKYYNEIIGHEDVLSLLELYKQQGFLKSKISLQTKYTAKKDSVSLTFLVTENQRTIIKSINFDSVSQLSDFKIEKFIKQKAGNAYYPMKVEAELLAFKTALISAGYLNTKTVLDCSFSKDSSLVDLGYKINSGKLILTGSVVVAGNLVTKDKVIINQLRLQAGKPMLAEKISDGLKNLRDQTVYNSIVFQSDENPTENNKRDIRVRVEENPPYYMESSCGYESSSGALLSFLFGNRNLAGKNLDLNVKGLYSQTIKSGEISFTEPLLLSIPLAMNMQLYIKEEHAFNSGFRSLVFGSGIGFKYKWSKIQTSFCSGIFENRHLDSLNTGYSIAENDRYLVNLNVGHQYDSRNSFVRPTSGWFAQFGISGFGGITSLKDNLVKYNLDVRNYSKPFKNVVFATKLFGGFLQEYNGGKQPMPDQLYFMGGATSIRGISENLFVKDSLGIAVGGITAVYTNLEIRPKFYESFELPLFCDVGLLVYKQGVHHKKIRITTGSGLRYVTAFGAMGFLYGFPVAEKDGYKHGCFHISIGYSF